ncbi:MAG: hypothetical protein ACREUA_11585, partial [Burkholderiales bacterium]
AKPSVEARLKRKFILMGGDHALSARLRDALPDGWEMVQSGDLDELGGFQDILLYRFILLDLDEVQAFDPQQVIRTVRMEMMLNVAIFCFGGGPQMRDEARLNRADRFFGREEIVEKMPEFCHQYRWGDG